MPVKTDGTTFTAPTQTKGVTLAPPPTEPSADYSLTLPVADGASGEVLTTDGAGALSFSAAGGLAVQELVIDSGTVAELGTNQVNHPLSGDDIFILSTELIRTAGTSTNVGVSIFPTDAYLTSIAFLYGSNLSPAIPIGNDPLYGPQFDAGSSTAYIGIPYHDVDESQELHVAFYNDGTGTGDFRLKVKYLVLGDFSA